MAPQVLRGFSYSAGTLRSQGPGSLEAVPELGTLNPVAAASHFFADRCNGAKAGKDRLVLVEFR